MKYESVEILYFKKNNDMLHCLCYIFEIDKTRIRVEDLEYTFSINQFKTEIVSKLNRLGFLTLNEKLDVITLTRTKNVINEPFDIVDQIKAVFEDEKYIAEDTIEDWQQNTIKKFKNKLGFFTS